MTSRMSYGLLASSGTISFNSGHSRKRSSEHSDRGGTASVWSGRNESMSSARSNASPSSSATRHATPLLLECALAPPSSSSSSSPDAISGISHGLLMNILPRSASNITKSESPAASALAPATVPIMTDMIGIRPEQLAKESSISPVAPRAGTPSSTR